MDACERSSSDESVDIDVIGLSNTPIPGDSRPGLPAVAMSHDTPGVNPPTGRATTSHTVEAKPTLLPKPDSETVDPTPSGDSAMASAVSGSTPPGSSSGKASSSGAPAADRSKDSKGKRERRERNAAEEKKKSEEVRLALWPTPEAVKTILHQTGERSIEYGRLLGSYRFRDAWLLFKKKSTPTSNDVSNLRKLSIDILSKRKGKPHRNSGEKSKPQVESKGESPKSTVTVGSSDKYDKRRRDSSSSSTGSGTKQPFKIPKISSSRSSSTAASEPVPGPAATSETSSWADAMEQDDADKEVVESEEQYGPLEGYTRDLGASLPTNYADAAQGKKQKLDYPFLLYIHKGRSLREKIPKKAWTLFMEKLNEILVEETLEDKPSPDIDWTGFKSGTGVIATVDEASRDIVEKIVEQIEVAELKFKAYPKGVKDEQTTVTIKVPSYLKNVEEQKLCFAFVKRNKLVGKFDLYGSRLLNRENGERLLRVVVDEKTINQVKDRGGKLKIGSYITEVYLANKRLG